MEARAPGIAPGAQGVEEGSQQVVDQYPEGGRGPVACAVAVVGDSCCSLEVDMSVASWVVGRRWEAVEDLEAVLWEGGTHDTEASGRHKWVAWGRRWGLRSSSCTAGSGNLHPTCRNWWWT